MKVGDRIQTPEGEGEIVEIQGDGKVGVVKVEKTIYVRLPDPPKEDEA
jgi:hypothetical protein